MARHNDNENDGFELLRANANRNFHVPNAQIYVNCFLR